MHNIVDKEKKLSKFQAWLIENQPKYMEVHQAKYEYVDFDKEGKKVVVIKNSGKGNHLTWKSPTAKAEYLKAKAEFKAGLSVDKLD